MPEQPDPDAALMLRVKRGDRAAFAELVGKFQQPVMNFVFRSLRDETEAEDLAQNVFLQVYKSRARYERTAKTTTSRSGNTRTKRFCCRWRMFCTANSPKKLRRRWPVCRRTSARPSCCAGRTN